MLSRLSQADGANEVRLIIQAELQFEQLTASDENVAEVAQAIVEQLDSLNQTGSIDAEGLSVTLLCLDS